MDFVNAASGKLDISCGSAYSIIHKNLKYYKICARWVTKQLTDEHKWACMEKCIQFLQQCEEVEAFQQQIIMGALL